MVNERAVIKKNKSTGDMEAGFLNSDTGEFRFDRKINSDEDIDIFLEDNNLSVVVIKKYNE